MPLYCSNTIFYTHSSSPFMIPSHILDDISVRFIINNPEFIILQPEIYFFILEEALWFATDFYGLPDITICAFAEAVLTHNGIFCDYGKDYSIFKAYKQSIKVYGTMMFNPAMTHCLLVQQQGSSTAITFPKGKKSKNETGIQCAIRETFEEVGYDVSKKIVDYTISIFDKITLYFVFNVDMKTEFKTNTRNEISKIFWFDLRKVDSVKDKRNYKLFTVAYHQAIKVIESLKANAFKFDTEKILNASQVDENAV